MARTKKQPTLAELQAKLDAEEAAYQAKLAALQTERDNRKKALAEALKAQQAAEQAKRKGDIKLVADKIAAVAVKLGLADRVYDGELSLADIEAALKGISAAPVSMVAPVVITSPAEQGPEVLNTVEPVATAEPMFGG